MKKRIICFIAGILAIYTSIIIIYHISCDASYKYNLLGDSVGIEYNDNLYVEKAVVEPYYLLYPDDFSVATPKKYYVRQLLCLDFFLPFQYFQFYSEKLDENEVFIVDQHCLTSALNSLFIKDDFVFPTIENNEIDEVWMSLSSSYHIIKDKDKVDIIVECAKSGGKIELDKDIVDYIKKHSWDGHCFNLKYSGYPLVEEFHLEETEDGKYTIGQYTAEEYETICWQDEAHQ